MSELPKSKPSQLARSARQHLDSLRAAGVEWVPAAVTEQKDRPSEDRDTGRLFDADPSGAAAQPTTSLFGDRADPTYGTTQPQKGVRTLSVDERCHALK